MRCGVGGRSGGIGSDTLDLLLFDVKCDSS